MTAHEELEWQQEAIARDVAAWLRSALNPDHPGAPAADRIVSIYMLGDIASALTRIAEVIDPPPRDEDTWQQRSIWEEFAAVVMFELPRIGYALGVLSDTDPKTLLERAAAQAEAPDMSAALEAEYQRGRADERSDVIAYLRTDYQDCDGEPWGLFDYTEGIERAEHVGANITTDAENYGDGAQ